MVATAVSAEDHVPSGTVELKVVDPEEQIACVPLNVPAVGASDMVTVRVAVASEQPPIPDTV